ncbi:hypothetical protein H1R20_g15435, partial [Candolleomyces eurysporus]
MVSYLMRLATLHHDPPVKQALVPLALGLLQPIVAPSGWPDIAVGWRFFSRSSEQNDFSNEVLVTQAVSAAKVLQVVALLPTLRIHAHR